MTRGSLRPLALAALALAGVTPVAAQTVAPDQTGTGGGPASTITAPNTNSLGVTKPPGTSLGPGEIPSRKERRRERALTDRIDDSICDGCN
jgi:hypothetical protein